MESVAKNRYQPICLANNQMGFEISIPQQPPLEQYSNFYGLIPEQFSEKNCIVAGFTGAITQESVGTSGECRDSRVLWQTVYPTQTKWQMENNHRSVGAKQLCRVSRVSNGISQKHSEINETKDELNKNRLQRRIFSYTHTPQIQKIYESGVVRKCLPVQSHAHGAQYFGQSVHQSVFGGSKVRESERVPYTRVPGRLALERIQSNSCRSSGTVSGKVVSGSGPDCQLRQVFSDTHSRYGVCGSSLQNRLGPGISSNKETGRVGIASQTVDRERGRYSQEMVQCYRQDGKSDGPGENGSSAQETITMAVTEQVGSEQEQLGPVCSSGEVVDPTSTVVVGQEEHGKWSAVRAVQTRDVAVHRCEPVGVWSDSGEPLSVRTMEQGGSRAPFQQQRNVGNNKSSRTLPRSVEELNPAHMLRQYHHCSNNKQARRYQVMEHDRNGLEAMEQAGRTELCNHSKAHTWVSERQSGRHVQDAAGNFNRMVGTSRGSDTSVAKVGCTTSGSLCNLPESQVNQVCVASTRSRGLGGKCNDDQLDRHVCVCISPIEASRRSTDEAGRGSSRDDPDSPILVNQVLVSSSARPTDSTSNTTQSERRSTETRALREDMQRSTVLQPSCVEVIRNSTKERGFSDKVADRIARGVRSSSQSIYKGKWKIYSDWCKSKNMDPMSSSVPQIADFLNHLFEEQELAVSTIKGYRSAISRVLNLTGKRDTAEDPYLHALISNFGIERPVNRKKYPSWDLTIVLKSLMKAPYEPIASAALKHVAKKTAFLLLLASGARRGEIHALDASNCVYRNQEKSMFLQPVAGFIAKNFNVMSGKCDFEGFIIKELEEESSLCPVRAIKWYLRRTKAIRGSIKHLFITNNRTGSIRAIHKNTLSGWIKRIIAQAYEVEESNKGPLLKRATHEIRAQAASYSLYANVSLENIMRQCRWAHHTTFTKFYLREIAGQQGELLVLPPVMSAGTVVNDRKKKKKKKKKGDKERR